MGKVIRYATLVVLAAFMIGGSAPAAPADDQQKRGDSILPSDEELEALSDMAQRMMRDLAGRMEPMAERLKALVDDLDAYESPEMLPNGDIIIRRKPDADPLEAPEDKDGIAL
ncbi:MAG: AAA+ family ATPase [Pseudomonadota bacterium]